MKKHLDRLHDQFALVPADKEVNNCKDYNINRILEDPRFNSASGNSHIDKLESKLTF